MSTSVQNDFYLYLVNQIDEDGKLVASCNLPSTIDLSRHNYEISLVELQLPGLWHNIYESTITLWNITDPTERVTMKIPNGHYKSYEAMGRVVDRYGKRAEYKLRNKLFNTQLKFAKTESGKSLLVIAAGLGVRFSERLMRICGLKINRLINDNDEDEDRIPITPDVQLWHYSLVAECNVVPYSSIGDYSGQILRVFSPDRNDNISSVRVHEIYVPVVSNMINKVVVTIHNRKGHPLVFESDEMVILVHLRKVI